MSVMMWKYFRSKKEWEKARDDCIEFCKNKGMSSDEAIIQTYYVFYAPVPIKKLVKKYNKPMDYWLGLAALTNKKYAHLKDEIYDFYDSRTAPPGESIFDKEEEEERIWRREHGIEEDA